MRYIIIVFVMSILGASTSLARTVLDLQKFSTESKVTYKNGVKARLTNLNKNVSRWYLLSLYWPKTKTSKKFHLENPFPSDQLIYLSKSRNGLLLRKKNEDTYCQFGEKPSNSQFVASSKEQKPFVPICDNRLLMRNQIKGELSTKEIAVDFLRENIWNGETVISFIKDTVYKDAEIITSVIKLKSGSGSAFVTDGPRPAEIESKFKGGRAPTGELGIQGYVEKDNTMELGKWYRAKRHNDVYIGIMQPQAVSMKIRKTFRNRVLPFDSVEKSAMVYLVAFDITDMEIGYSLGTEHPKVTYSERTYNYLKKPGWKGPDGIQNYSPLVSTGMVSPVDAQRIIATFTGGFKRKHSVFRAGKPAKGNGGTHYGFLQNGVVFSTLHSGLATAIVTKDGDFEIKTWEASDNKRLGDIMFARQNGLPLVYRNKKDQRVTPGRYVRQNFRGNWSGSKQNTVRALRTGLCIQNVNDRKMVIYGFFSSHTPNAMARVFQAYDCEYAMHLDMNMIVHTYLATYFRGEKDKLTIEHIVDKMRWKDKKFKDVTLPRFVAVPDNRDFFYLMRKKPKPGKLSQKKSPPQQEDEQAIPAQYAEASE